MFPLLSSAYLAPVQWYAKLFQSNGCWMEQHDHFIKQTYRNRCVIATTNGLQALTVPIERFEGAHCAMLNIRISDHGSWRHLHWNALQSAYGESPFFEFYADDIRPFFERRWDFLVDFNMEITQKMCELLDIQPHITLTDAYVSAEDVGVTDYRDVIRPKNPLPDDRFQPRRYYQVYEQKHGFQPNLSILDLLFNEGPEAVLYL